jgi:hypothetical protein
MAHAAPRGTKRTGNSGQDGWTSGWGGERMGRRRCARRWRRCGQRRAHDARRREQWSGSRSRSGRGQGRAEQTDLAIRCLVARRRCAIRAVGGMADDAIAGQRGNGPCGRFRHGRPDRELRGQGQQRDNQAVQGAPRTHRGGDPNSNRRITQCWVIRGQTSPAVQERSPSGARRVRAGGTKPQPALCADLLRTAGEMYAAPWASAPRCCRLSALRRLHETHDAGMGCPTGDGMAGRIVRPV